MSFEIEKELSNTALLWLSLPFSGLLGVELMPSGG